MPDRFFASRTGRGVRVAVVDSGIHAAHPHVGGVAGGVALVPLGADAAGWVDRLGHGTAVAAAIREKAPETEIHAVKVFDRRLATGASTLVRAIDWAVEHAMHLVNLSLGTANSAHGSALAAALARARAAGCVVVAAREHQGAPCLPGSLPSALPILLDWECPRPEYRVQRDDAGVAFRASGYPRPIPGVAQERNLKGISFAVASMTGFAARALEAHPGASLEDLVAVLERAAGSA